jgi:hypothetical protein
VLSNKYYHSSKHSFLGNLLGNLLDGLLGLWGNLLGDLLGDFLGSDFLDGNLLDGFGDFLWCSSGYRFNLRLVKLF